MTQAEIANVAAMLAAGVTTNLPDDLPADPTLGNDKANKATFVAWELYRVFYHAVAGTVGHKDWPVPVTAAGADGSGQPIIDAMKKLMGDLGPTLQPFLTKLLADLMKNAAPVAAAVGPPLLAAAAGS